MIYYDFRDIYLNILRETRIILYKFSNEIIALKEKTIDNFIILELMDRVIKEISEQRACLLMCESIPFDDAMYRILHNAKKITNLLKSIDARAQNSSYQSRLTEICHFQIRHLKEIAGANIQCSCLYSEITLLSMSSYDYFQYPFKAIWELDSQCTILDIVESARDIFSKYLNNENWQENYISELS